MTKDVSMNCKQLFHMFFTTMSHVVTQQRRFGTPWRRCTKVMRKQIRALWHNAYHNWLISSKMRIKLSRHITIGWMSLSLSEIDMELFVLLWSSILLSFWDWERNAEKVVSWSRPKRISINTHSRISIAYWRNMD